MTDQLTLALAPPKGNPPPSEVPPGVVDLYEQFALQVAGRGFKRYSSDAILHRIRWHHHVDKGDREFKCNDHWTAPLARWFLRQHPELPEFFELRNRKLKEVPSHDGDD